MGFIKRLFKIGESEVNSAIDKLEDPIKLTEQGIRDLKKDLDSSLQALAEVKAMVIRSQREVDSSKKQAADYERKALLLLQKVEKGEIDASDADALASKALEKQQECVQRAAQSQTNLTQFDTNVTQLERNVEKLRSTISQFENELKTLKARAKVSSATKKLNKQMAKIDSGSTISMLERMKEKVDEDEALSEAYGDIANESRSVDDQLDAAIGSSSTGGSDALAALKAKMKKN